MPASPPSAMVSKWSSKSKSPKQKATQIRDNQRRHRAKVKAHISTLENELAESQRRLIAAEHRITALTAEVKRLVEEARGEPALTSISSVERSFNSPTPHTTLEYAYCRPLNNQRQRGNSLPSKHNAMVNLPFDRPVIPNSNNDLSGLNAGNDIEVDESTLALAFVAEYDCQTLPLPQPGESTTNCVAAYRIIGQQNFKGVDMEAIHQCLQSGYRRATRPGDGCTVVNSHLFGLISYLSPV
ncbi:uncharacterized protein TrAFT101_011112 [Trichoderma asperellum]|uniref:BZIP domain-containing protein n=1 Tax=Trichoderma asperellum (strain ATCC 204424 / CBS 433.97 / NBRC 101777) TaxID=1042311 RepID=A0A2T3YXX3_TRIA4|nr:hypothetical protein M441DRAFT_61332 [Trichoderma asperellum CBS 433.97]PTB37387.1 hypothetical protein M441DRAFT_61332 [Trichoderma asperellum CBS 433.97]UKZ96315.1 hypothetical protein TrAFT101_011112 [Trichoderma asperellum]